MKADAISRATGSGATQRTPASAASSKPSSAKPSANHPRQAWLKAIGLTSQIESEPHRLFADVVEEWAQRQPSRPALLSEGGSFTYGELAARINRYARWARGLGIGSGRTVALLMPNRPDYLACWLGISKIGGTVALINTRLVGRSLAHCIDIARADHLVLATECTEAFESARPHLKHVPRIWWLGAGDARTDLDAALAAADPHPLSATERGEVTIERHRPSDLHFGYHRTAEGSECQPSAHSLLGRMVRGADRRFPRRPPLRLPAAASFRWRHGRALQLASRRRFGRDCGKVLRQNLLGRHRALRLHRLPIYRRALPLPVESAGIRTGGWTPAAARRRQRIARRHLGGVRRAVRDSADTRILRGDGRQFLAVQRGRKTRRDRPNPATVGAPLPRFDRAGRTPTATRSAGGTGSVSPAPPARSATRSGASVPPRRAEAISRAIPIRSRPKRRSCVMSLRLATPGSAPAI